MDRFKFRVYIKYAKMMCYDVNSFYIDRLKNKITIHFDEHTKTFKFDDVVLEQCTGLKDKNGKLIYEGDILGGIYGGYISWCDECKSFELFVPEFRCASCNGDVLWQEIVQDDGILEILGNIHENADLLEN